MASRRNETGMRRDGTKPAAAGGRAPAAPRGVSPASKMMKMSALRKRATVAGMTDAEIEDALDAGDPKVELLRRIEGREQARVLGRERARHAEVARGWSLPPPPDASPQLGPTIGLAAGSDSAGNHGTRYTARPPLVCSAIRIPMSLAGMLAASELRAAALASAGRGIPMEAAAWVALCFLSTLVASATGYEVWCFSLKIFGVPAAHRPRCAMLDRFASRRRAQNRVDVYQPLSHRFGDQDLGPKTLPPSPLPASDDQIRAAYATQAVVVDRTVEAFVAPILVCTAVGFWDVLEGWELGLDACAGLFSAIISVLEAISLRPTHANSANHPSGVAGKEKKEEDSSGGSSGSAPGLNLSQTTTRQRNVCMIMINVGMVYSLLFAHGFNAAERWDELIGSAAVMPPVLLVTFQALLCLSLIARWRETHGLRLGECLMIFYGLAIRFWMMVLPFGVARAQGFLTAIIASSSSRSSSSSSSSHGGGGAAAAQDGGGGYMQHVGGGQSVSVSRMGFGVVVAAACSSSVCFHAAQAVWCPPGSVPDADADADDNAGDAGSSSGSSRATRRNTKTQARGNPLTSSHSLHDMIMNSTTAAAVFPGEKGVKNAAVACGAGAIWYHQQYQQTALVTGNAHGLAGQPSDAAATAAAAAVAAAGHGGAAATSSGVLTMNGGLPPPGGGAAAAAAAAAAAGVAADFGSLTLQDCTFVLLFALLALGVNWQVCQAGVELEQREPTAWSEYGACAWRLRRAENAAAALRIITPSMVVVAVLDPVLLYPMARWLGWWPGTPGTPKDTL
jgi:hypothetical protein